MYMAGLGICWMRERAVIYDNLLLNSLNFNLYLLIKCLDFPDRVS